MKHRAARLFGIVLLIGTLLFGTPLVVITYETHHTCVAVNAVREQLLNLVDQGVRRSERLANAPGASAAQKLNYSSAWHGRQTIREGLALDRC